MRRTLLMAMAALTMSVTAATGDIQFYMEQTGSDPCEYGTRRTQQHFTVYSMTPSGAPGRLLGYLRVDCDGRPHFTEAVTSVSPQGNQFDRLIHGPEGSDYIGTFAAVEELFPNFAMTITFTTEDPVDNGPAVE